jgi:hypothetical protein
MQSLGTPHLALSLFSDEGLVFLLWVAPCNRLILVDETFLEGLASSPWVFSCSFKLRMSFRRSTTNDVSVTGILARPFARSSELNVVGRVGLSMRGDIGE